MFMMTFYFSRVTDLTYAKSAPDIIPTVSAICTMVFETNVRQVKRHVINLQNARDMFTYCSWAWQE